MKFLFALMKQFHVARDVEHPGSFSKQGVIRFAEPFFSFPSTTSRL
ncbi:MAG: hypothetical protein K0R79_2021 [Stenotrophomonas indicatrix]|nr:hypothetical protein [Stenotrophomonas indicatrix]